MTTNQLRPYRGRVPAPPEIDVARIRDKAAFDLKATALIAQPTYLQVRGARPGLRTVGLWTFEQLVGLWAFG